MESYYSQFGEDKWLCDNINLPPKGFFIDVGAADGITNSNTFLLEKRGWIGICIDPDPRHSKKLLSSRSTVELCAIGAQNSTAKFFLHNTRPTRSSIYQLNIDDYQSCIEVPIYTLETILKKHNVGTIDLLDIDVEGAELVAWQSFDHKVYEPKVIIIEYADDRPNSHKSLIIKTLVDNQYSLVHQTCANLIFLNNKWVSKLLK